MLSPFLEIHEEKAYEQAQHKEIKGGLSPAFAKSMTERRAFCWAPGSGQTFIQQCYDAHSWGGYRLK